jgi:hypothetical protein
MAKIMETKVATIDGIPYTYRTWVANGVRAWCFDREFRRSHMKTDRVEAFMSAKKANCLSIAISRYRLALETEWGSCLAIFHLGDENWSERDAYDLKQDSALNKLRADISRTIKRYERGAIKALRRKSKTVR